MKRNSETSTKERDMRKININSPQNKIFKNNQIKTAKYNMYNIII